MKVNLPKHILELLLKDEVVQVPGLGTFGFATKSASFGEGRKSLLPPRKTISYSEVHNNSDQSLAKIIAEQNGLSLSKAQAFIEEFSSEVLSGLMSSNQVEIAYLGQLEKDEKGKVNFKSNAVTEERINKWKPELKLPPVQAVKPPVFEVEKPVVPKPTSQVGTRVEPVPMIQNTKPIEEEDSGIKSWLFGCLGLLGLLAVTVVGFKMCSSTESSFKTKAQIENEEYIANGGEENAEVIEEEIKYNDDSDASMGSNDIQSENEPSKEKAKGQLEGSCIIILGSFTNDENVQAITRKVRNSRYDLYTEEHGPYTRVGVQAPCLKISDDYKGFLSKIRSEFNVNGAWYLNPELKDI